MKIEVSLFRFDKNSDYLPYYTKHFIKTKEVKTLLDILRALNQEDKFGFYDSLNFDLVVNQKYTNTSVLVEDLIEKFGNELVIEPISTKRVYKDLLINEDDFIDKLEIFSEFLDKSTIQNYESYKAYYYASPTLKFTQNYIGDAVLILAFDLIQKFPNKKEQILEILKKQRFGAEFHTNLKYHFINFDDNIEEKIRNIQKSLDILSSFKFKKYIDFTYFNEVFKVVNDFNGFNIARFFEFESCKNEEFFKDLKADFIDIEKVDLAKESFKKNPKLTIFLASKILLEAFDSGADFLLLDSEENIYLFDKHRTVIEKITNRKIPLPVIFIEELKYLCANRIEDAKYTLKNHKVKVDIV